MSWTRTALTGLGLLAIASVGACTSPGPAQIDGARKGTEAYALAKAMIPEKERREKLVNRQIWRALFAGVEPAAAIELYEPFGVPLRDNGPMPLGLEWLINRNQRAGWGAAGLYTSYLAPVPSDYFDKIAIHVDMRKDIIGVHANTEPLPREECFRRLGQILTFWIAHYPSKDLMRHPDLERGLFYLVPMEGDRKARAFTQCEIVNRWGEYELWVVFNSVAGIDTRWLNETIEDWVMADPVDEIQRVRRAR